MPPVKVKLERHTPLGPVSSRRTKTKRTKKAVAPYTKCVRESMYTTMSKHKHGTLRFARSKANPAGRPVTKRKQAIAIGLSIAPKKCAGKSKVVVVKVKKERKRQ